MMRRITAADNPHYKHLKRLARSARERRSSACCLLDGMHLIEAYGSHCGRPQEILVSESGLARTEIAAYLAGDRCADAITLLSDRLFGDLALVDTPSGIMAVVALPQAGRAPDHEAETIVLDGVQDPGNVGTVLRSADAFGLDAVFLTNACADVYNPKTVRAAMGSLFRVPVYRMEPDEFLSLMHAAKLPVYAATLSEDSVSVRDISLARAAVIVGSEGKGVSEYLRRMSDARVIIPMCGRAESLNAGVAASLIAYLFTCT